MSTWSNSRRQTKTGHNCAADATKTIDNQRDKDGDINMVNKPRLYAGLPKRQKSIPLCYFNPVFEQQQF